VILDPADQMRSEAQNSMLKTLEEPPSRTVMILIATNPHLLLETIRSRARILPFGEIPSEQIVRRLTLKEGKSGQDAILAAALSGGSLGAALEFDTAEYRDARESALEFVTLLLNRGSFTSASAIVAGITKDKKDKDVFRTWIESARRFCGTFTIQAFLTIVSASAISSKNYARCGKRRGILCLSAPSRQWAN